MKFRIAGMVSAFLCAGLVAVLGWAQEPGKNNDPVVIYLRSDATVDGKLVRIEHVASVNYGPAKLRETIARMDLAEFNESGSLVITRDIIWFRLQIAGINKEQFRITGVQRTQVRQYGAEGGASGKSSPSTTADRKNAILPVKNEVLAIPEGPILIKIRDRIKIIAHLDSTSLIATGEAQQDGRLGQTIRVRNIDSNKTIQGRITAPNQVEVEY